MDNKVNLLKRLKIQSWRRGMKEMDLILGRFIDKNSHLLSPSEILSYDHLLLQDDQLIFSWFSGQKIVPREFRGIIEKISACVDPQIN